MKPLFGNAATSAPKAALFRSAPGAPHPCGRSLVIASATVSATIGSAHTACKPISTGSISLPSGKLAPKRNSRQGSAKYNP